MIFIANKYTDLYFRIINNANSRVSEGYTEKHHIIPKSTNGDNDSDNLVTLTAREHFLCHYLLTKMFEKDTKEYVSMVRAFYMMRAASKRHDRYMNSRLYETNKAAYSKIASERMSGENNPQWNRKWTDEEKAEHGAKIKGRVQPQHEKEKQIAAITGRTRDPFSDEWRDNLSKAGAGKNNSMYGKKHTADAKAKMSIKAKGRKQSAETIEKKRLAMTGNKREKKYCPHCNRDISLGWYNRHGDNCKRKISHKKAPN